MAVPPYFRQNQQQSKVLIAAKRWSDKAEFFSRHYFSLPDVPDWHTNLFSQGQRADAAKSWNEIGDFDPALGDVKTVWEASRFDWLAAMAQRAALGNDADLSTLNHWIADWAKKNPPYLGTNWKCGQEASIRVMHLALAAMLLNQETKPEPGLITLIETHLKRIAPTISYAIGQANNHGTSEASALFIGGSWLSAFGHEMGGGWAKQGRHWLEDRARSLIEPDGTFSQYSMVYHRLMLDSYSLAEVWRRRLNLSPFSEHLVRQLRAAAHWLEQMTDPHNGDAPNLGANDGAQLLKLADEGYRDFRPSVQLGSVLFCGLCVYSGSGQWDQPLHWLNIAKPVATLPALSSETLDHGGLHILRSGRNRVYLRYPRFRFRPSQADALHVDLWVDGENILRDAGSYSYNAPDDEGAYFSSVAAHNSVQFDGRDQMPRLSRFLFGSWLKAIDVKKVVVNDGRVCAAAAYVDYKGAQHHRTVELNEKVLVCTDLLSGNAQQAVLRWRLRPGSWQLFGNSVTDGKITLKVLSDDPSLKLAIAVASESLYYLEKTEIPVIEVTCSLPISITTEVHF